MICYFSFRECCIAWGRTNELNDAANNSEIKKSREGIVRRYQFYLKLKKKPSTAKSIINSSTLLPLNFLYITHKADKLTWHQRRLFGPATGSSSSFFSLVFRNDAGSDPSVCKLLREKNTAPQVPQTQIYTFISNLNNNPLWTETPSLKFPSNTQTVKSLSPFQLMWNIWLHTNTQNKHRVARLIQNSYCFYHSLEIANIIPAPPKAKRSVYAHVTVVLTVG